MKAPGVVLAGLVAVFLYGPSLLQDGVFFVESASGDEPGENSGGPSTRRSFKRPFSDSRESIWERSVRFRPEREDTDQVPPLPPDWNRPVFQTGRDFSIDRLAMEIKEFYSADVARQHAAEIVLHAAFRFSLTEEEQGRLLEELGPDYSVMMSFRPVPAAAPEHKPRRRPSLRRFFRRGK